MTFLLVFIIGLVIGGLIVYLIMKSLFKPAGETKENAQEIKDSNPAVEERKANLEELEKYIATKSAEDKITNDEIQTFLKVSDATAERYLQELEENGLIKQYGEVGKDVYYLKV